MEPRCLTLTLAFALLLTADSPLPTLSTPSPHLHPPPPPLRSPPPPPRPPSPRSPPRPSSSSSSPPPSPPPTHHHRRRHRRPEPPFWPTGPFDNPGDAHGTPGRPPPPTPPPVSCAIVSKSACGRQPSPQGLGLQPSAERSRGATRWGSGLNLGEKVGLAFAAVVVVLQVVVGGFLIYRRRQIRRIGYRRDLASSSSSPSALPSAN